MENYITLRVRKETHRKLKIVAAHLQESILETVERLATQELDRVQKGYTDAPQQKDQARRE